MPEVERVLNRQMRTPPVIARWRSAPPPTLPHAHTQRARSPACSTTCWATCRPRTPPSIVRWR
eukprot:228983-Chlamydomonas_euryale.AAC.1